MMKKYNEFKDAVNNRRSWMRFCEHHLQKAIECNNEESTNFWAESYAKALVERDTLFGSYTKYAVLYKLTHRCG